MASEPVPISKGITHTISVGRNLLPMRNPQQQKRFILLPHSRSPASHQTNMKPILTSFLILLFAATPELTAGPPTVIDVKVTGRGRPMMFIPGLASPGGVWDSVVNHFTDRYECHVVTIAGFGGAAPANSEHLLTDVRDQLIVYAQKNKLSGVIIVGHSLGGNIGLDIAMNAPDLPADLVVVDSLPFLAAVIAPGVRTLEDAKGFAASLKASMQHNTQEQFAAL